MIVNLLLHMIMLLYSEMYIYNTVILKQILCDRKLIIYYILTIEIIQLHLIGYQIAIYRSIHYQCAIFNLGSISYVVVKNLNLIITLLCSVNE